MKAVPNEYSRSSLACMMSSIYAINPELPKYLLNSFWNSSMMLLPTCSMAAVDGRQNLPATSSVSYLNAYPYSGPPK